MAETHSSRITSYKNAAKGGNQELRRKRAEVSVSLRKQAREEQLLKRRAFSPEGDSEENTRTDDAEPVPTPDVIVKGLLEHQHDVCALTKYARAARRILSREQHPPIAVMVAAGCIRPLVAALDRDECADLQFEAAWALTNIASGSRDQTLAVVEGGAVPKLVRLAEQGGQVAEQSIWALGNIAGDGAQTRDIVLQHGALPALLPSLTMGRVPLAQSKNAVWALSNLCRNKNPMVSFDIVSPALTYVSNLLTCDDQDILADSCWALSYLTDGPNDRIEGVELTPNLLQRVVRLLDHKSVSVRTPALRAVGNMLTGSDIQTDRVLDAGCLPLLAKLLASNKPALVKESAWAVSNVLAGTQEQIQRFIDEGLLEPLVLALAHSEPRCQKEAAWAITNMCLGGSVQQLGSLLAVGFLKPYSALLDSHDAKTVTVVLEGITHLMQAAERYGEVEQMSLRLEEEGALDKIEALQSHENEQVYKKTLHLIDTYFSESNDDVANEPTANDGEFQFGPTSGAIGNF